MKNKVTLLNMLSTLLLQICTVISGFIIPRIILSYFGSDVNGLVSSQVQFLSYISLVEGGVSGVIAANLYKPLVDGDCGKVSSTVSTANAFYKKVGFIFIAYTVALGIIYPSFINTGFSFIYVFVLTLILSSSLFIQYMFSLTLRTLLTADKKVYIVSFVQVAIVVCNIVLSCITVEIYPSIHLLKLISGLLYIVQPVVFGRYIKSHYEIDWNAKVDNGLIDQRWNGFAVNVAAFIHNSTDMVLLTLFTNLQTVSVYSVYALVTNGLKSLISSIASGINPTLGQAYAKDDPAELNEKMDLYEYIIFVLVGLSFTVASLLITPFIMLFTHNITDADYYQPLFGYLIVLSEGLYLIMFPHLNLAYSANKFKEITKPAYIEAIINIVVSVILVMQFRLIGVAIGTIVGMTYRLVFQIYYTSKIVPSRKQSIFYRKLLIFSGATIISLLLCNLFPMIDLTVMEWIVHATVYCLILALIYLAVSFIFFRQEMLFFVRYIRKR